MATPGNPNLMNMNNGAQSVPVHEPGQSTSQPNIAANPETQRGPNNLVDDFEQALQACFASFLDSETTNTDSDEMKAGIHQSLQKFLDSAKSLEAFFLQKRLLLSVQRPELLVKEDIAELRSELVRKEQLIQKHYEKLQSWQDMLNNLQQGATQPAQTQPPAQPSTAPVQQVAPPAAAVRHPAPMSMVHQGQGHPQASMPSPHHQMHQMAPQFPQPMHHQHPMQEPMMQQGPLAKLERSTANIGMEGWQ